MSLLFPFLLLVLGGLFLLRSSSGRFVDRAKDAWGPGWFLKHERAVCALVLFVSTLPLLRLAPGISQGQVALFGDMASHAHTVGDISRSSLERGWIDSFVGGFPMGHHYPPASWLLSWGAVKLGLTPAAAVYYLGWGAVAITPWVLFAGLLRSSLLPRFALLAALLLQWAAPYNAFIGGWETFFSMGLLSQALGLPACLWLAAAVAAPINRFEAPLAATVAMSCHPQIAVATSVVMTLGAICAGAKRPLFEVIRADLVGVIAGVALYGQGVVHLNIPFGWPSGFGWQHLGFPPRRLADWFVEGRLLDQGRWPGFTILTLSAFVLLAVRLRHPIVRATLSMLGAALFLSVSGRFWLDCGRLGSFLLSFFQPLRITALLPPLSAASVALALQLVSDAGAQAARAAPDSRIRRAVAASPFAVTLLFILLGLPPRLDYMENIATVLRAKGEPCRGVAGHAPGYDTALVSSWFEALPRGPTWYDTRDRSLVACIGLDALDSRVGFPVFSTDAVGSHVGVLRDAAQRLDPLRPGSAERAEALGVRYLLRNGTRPLPGGWRTLRRNGEVELASIESRRVGAGCIVRRWTGPEAALRDQIITALRDQARVDELLAPHAYTEIVVDQGPFTETQLSPGNCSIHATALEVLLDSPGELLATTRSATPFDLVVRKTAFPSWSITVDGIAREPRLIAPGFFALRVDAGTHEVRAETRPLPGYLSALFAGALAVFALSFIDPKGMASRRKSQTL